MELMGDYFSPPVSLLLVVALLFSFTASPALIYPLFAHHTLVYYVSYYIFPLCLSSRLSSPWRSCCLCTLSFPLSLVLPLFSPPFIVAAPLRLCPCLPLLFLPPYLFFLSRFFSSVYRVVSGGCGMTL